MDNKQGLAQNSPWKAKQKDVPHLTKLTLYMEQPSDDPVRNIREIKSQTILKRKIRALIPSGVKPNSVSRMKMHRRSLPASLLLP